MDRVQELIDQKYFRVWEEPDQLQNFCSSLTYAQGQNVVFCGIRGPSPGRHFKGLRIYCSLNSKFGERYIVKHDQETIIKQVKLVVLNILVITLMPCSVIYY